MAVLKKRFPREKRVRIAASRFGIAPEKIEAALNDIDRQMEERARSELARNKAGKRRLRVLDAAAHRLLIAHKHLPADIATRFVPPTFPVELEEIREAIAPFLAIGKPRRGDAYEKRLAAVHAMRLLPQDRSPPPKLKSWHELAALLYGSGRVADVERTCRTVGELISLHHDLLELLELDAWAEELFRQHEAQLSGIPEDLRRRVEQIRSRWGPLRPRPGDLELRDHEIRQTWAAVLRGPLQRER